MMMGWESYYSLSFYFSLAFLFNHFTLCQPACPDSFGEHTNALTSFANTKNKIIISLKPVFDRLRLIQNDDALSDNSSQRNKKTAL